MTPVADNRQFYEHEVFDHWASRTALNEFEERLFERFLDRDRSTLEAGTGGGRILHELATRGFGDLHGFDYVPGFIDAARARDASGATALFSFLCFEERTRHALYGAFNRYLGLLRRFRHRGVSLQYQPWLKADARPNLGALADHGPYVYWYTLEEALDALDRVVFDITWVAVHGMLYVACRRP